MEIEHFILIQYLGHCKVINKLLQEPFLFIILQSPYLNAYFGPMSLRAQICSSPIADITDTTRSFPSAKPSFICTHHTPKHDYIVWQQFLTRDAQRFDANGYQLCHLDSSFFFKALASYFTYLDEYGNMIFQQQN